VGDRLSAIDPLEVNELRRQLREAVELLQVFGFCLEVDPDHELLFVERRMNFLERHEGIA